MQYLKFYYVRIAIACSFILGSCSQLSGHGGKARMSPWPWASSSESSWLKSEWSRWQREAKMREVDVLNVDIKEDMMTKEEAFEFRKKDLCGGYPITLLERLETAIDRGKYQKVRNILGEVYCVDMQDQFGNSLLHRAVRKSQFNVVKMLVEEFNTSLDIVNHHLETPLDLAVREGKWRKKESEEYKKIAVFLLSKKASSKSPSVNQDPFYLEAVKSLGLQKKIELQQKQEKINAIINPLVGNITQTLKEHNNSPSKKSRKNKRNKNKNESVNVILNINNLNIDSFNGLKGQDQVISFAGPAVKANVDSNNQSNSHNMHDSNNTSNSHNADNRIDNHTDVNVNTTFKFSAC